MPVGQLQMQGFTNPANEYGADQQEIAYRRMLADALRQDAMSPIDPNRMAGRFVVPVSPMEGISKVAKGALAGFGMYQTGEQQKQLADRRNTALSQALSQMPMASQRAMPTDQEGTGSFDMSGSAGPQTVMQRPTMRDNAVWLGQLGQIGPDALRIGSSVLGMQQHGEELEAGRQARLQERLMQIEAAQQQANLSREERAARAAEAAALRRELQTSQQEFQAQQARLAAEDRRSLAGMTAALTQQNRPPVAVMGPDGRPVYVSQDQAVGRQPMGKGAAQLPPSALKLQQEELENIGIASSVKSDLASLQSQIEGGKLNPSLVNNAIGTARNVVGLSNEESRNLASFKATLEKMRNDSLRLNKGVQTEGDAIRAWNELIDNTNDKGVVLQRLKEIQKINDRAVNLRRMNIDSIRSNFGLESLDTSRFENQPPAVGATGASGGWAVVR